METLNNNQQTTGLQTFFNDGINAGIRMKMIDGESWFIAKDICCALGLQDVSMTVHVCKVYSGNTISRRIADRLTKLAISHKNKGIIYPEPVPVYRQLLIEWEEQG